MDFLTSSLIGGLIYDVFNLSLSSSLDIVKVALKDYVLSDKEKGIIANSLDNASKEDKNSKNNLIEYFENSKEIKELLKTQKITKITNSFNNNTNSPININI